MTMTTTTTMTTDLERHLHNLPNEILHKILQYTYNVQNQQLLNDIRNFETTKQFLLENLCDSENSILDVIMRFYDCSHLLNCNEHVLKKINKWIKKRVVMENIDDVCVIVFYPDISTLFTKHNKWIFLWGILPPIIRNKYLNLLYSLRR